MNHSTMIKVELDDPTSNRIEADEVLSSDEANRLLIPPPNESEEVRDQTNMRICSSLKPLSNKEALIRLHNDIKDEISMMKDEFAKRSLASWLLESVSFKSELSKMRWPSVVFMTAHALAHFIVSFILRVDNLATNWIGFQGFILTIFLIFNLAVNLWDTKLRFKELLMKAEQISIVIERCSKDRHLLKQWRQYCWKSASVKTLFIPKSPCIHQTLTYRDDSCLNLPDYLLVRDDIIHLFPGDRAPGDCVSLSTSLGEQSSNLSYQNKSLEQIILKEDEIFYIKGPQSVSEQDSKNLRSQDSVSVSSHAHLRGAKKGADFLVLRTPYIKSLRISLQRSHKRPVNSIEKECFIVSRKYFETYVIPLVFILSTIVTAIHYGYLDLTDSDQEIKTISIAYLLLRPSLTIMPFLPWMFPCFWMAVNAYGSARLLCCAESQRHQTMKDNSKINCDWFGEQSPGWDDNKRAMGDMRGSKSGFESSNFDNLLATPTAAGSSDQNKHQEGNLHDLQNRVEFIEILRVSWDLILGKSGHVWRSSSLLQVLGCLTSLCCIDKVGILSWSNPTPEKVFVLTKNQNNTAGETTRQHLIDSRRTSHSDDANSTSSHLDKPDETNLQIKSPLLGQNSNLMVKGSCPSSTTNIHGALMKHASNHHRAEILDVSQTFNNYRSFVDQCAPLVQETRLQFDEPNWTRYINNLKPLGLAIMINNCCEQSFGDYFRFYKHINYESVSRCNQTPVVKRRCLCALSRLIGFSKDAVKKYNYLNQIAAYKLSDPNAIRRDKIVSSLENTTRLKLPFPNMVCNIHQDSTTGSYQMSSQGTADIVLDSCVEFWNGSELVPLDEPMRKKAMDFYHRSSLTSYCSAFAYAPCLKGHNLADNYIEMPTEDSKFSPQLRRLANEHLEEFLQMQVVSSIKPVPHDLRNHCEFDQDLELTSLSTTPILSSPESNKKYRRRASIDRKNFVQSFKKVPRRYLSAEDLSSRQFDMDDTGSVRSETKKTPDRQNLVEALDEITDQVFVGMVALQYQACPDFVVLVEQLEHACIRFVHFSKENELRSRVFSEKMGLESGWNCHISLQSDQDLDKAATLGRTVSKASVCDTSTTKLDPNHPTSFSPTVRISNILLGSRSDKSNNSRGLTRSTDVESNYDKRSLCSEVGTLYTWKSLPSLVMQIISKMSNSSKHHYQAHRDKLIEFASNEQTLSVNVGQVAGEDDLETDNHSASEEPESSAKDEGFDTLAFDMSNRAKLPKGIENIRPHLETVDNIPLQVSLFTDCTPELTKEMIEIMQDYGEIVCVIGSASSRANTPIFLQANASIAIEPLLPQCCTHIRTRTSLTSGGAGSRKTSQEPALRRQSTKDASEAKNLNLESPVLRPFNNPRDRLGMGPRLYGNEQIGRNGKLHKNPTLDEVSLSSSSSASPSSSSSNSSTSSSSTQSATSKFSQTLSDSASIITKSSSCSSNKSSDNDSENPNPDYDEDPSSSLVNEFPDPSRLASKLASLPCSYNYNRKEPVNLYSLIMEARHFTFKMKNTFVCMICFALSISSAQFLASLLFLPPMLSSGLTIWLTVVVVPLMSFSLMSTTIDSQVMKIAVGKNLQLKPENITFFVICYLIKFIPSIIVVVLNFGLIIAHSCKLTGFGSSSLGPCWMFTYVRHGNSTSNTDTGDEDLLWSSHLLTAQVSAAFLMVLYFVVISSGFVHRSHLMWQRSPTRNHFWVVISMALIIGQLLVNQLVLQFNLESTKIPYEFLASLPLYIWLISFMWPVLVISINLLVKRAEIKATIRQQRRARFDFNTKLGMNSPF